MRYFFILIAVIMAPAVSFSAGAGASSNPAELTPLLVASLIAHVVIGLIGIMGLYILWMGLLKKNSNAIFLFWTALVSAVTLVASWIAGGYYYVVYYGSAVKPVIKAGEYPWAHLVIMETKEHVFLFLPVVSVLLAIILYVVGNSLNEKPALRKNLSWLAGAAALVGIFTAVAGVVISGSV